MPLDALSAPFPQLLAETGGLPDRWKGKTLVPAVQGFLLTNFDVRVWRSGLPALSVALALALRFSAFICCSFAAFICSALRAHLYGGRQRISARWSGGLRSAGRKLPLCGQALACLRAFAQSRRLQNPAKPHYRPGSPPFDC